MKKIRIFFVILFMAGLSQANPVSVDVARVAAANCYSQHFSSSSPSLTLAYTEKDENGNPVYYVFNVGDNSGFVIISAEDAGLPLIGISNYGQYVVPTGNNNISYWMNKRKTEIISIRALNGQATSDIAAEWNGYINNTVKNSHDAMNSVSSLLGGEPHGIEWDQSPWYNAMCPGGSVTGCVATAMAQIMKFWKEPALGIGSTCYYDEISYGYSENYGHLCAGFDTSHYVWASMPNKLSGSNAEVAELMYDCGVAVNMDYTPTGSGALVIGHSTSALTAYPTYFHYNASTIKGVYQSSYSTSSWISLLEGELNAGRPMQYQGTDPSEGGHSWVCDGYNTSDQFHMNWGWSGTDDGYFTATSLNPGTFDFSQDIGVVMGIEPIVTSVPAIATSNAFSIYPNPGNGIFTIQREDNTGTSQICVYNVLGQEVYSSKLVSLQSSLNLSSQAKGIYLYKVVSETGKQISTGRLVIE